MPPSPLYLPEKGLIIRAMNKETFIAVDKYYEDLHLGEDKQFDEINSSADDAGLPSIQISPLQGKFLHLLVLTLKAKRILEIGTLGGYSTAWMASGLPQDGKLISLEIDPHHAAVAEKSLSKYDFQDKVEIRVGEGLQLLGDMILAKTAPFDLIFIDADKEGYAAYLNQVLNLSVPGTLIIADNVVRNGKILEIGSQDTAVLGIQKFNQAVIENPRLTASTLQMVGAKSYDGFTFIVVRNL
jgi:predicted O-methyltransferase YrrM